MHGFQHHQQQYEKANVRSGDQIFESIGMTALQSAIRAIQTRQLNKQFFVFIQDRNRDRDGHADNAEEGSCSKVTQVLQICHSAKCQSCFIP